LSPSSSTPFSYTTLFRSTFKDALYARIAELPNVRSIKIPGVPADPAAARARVEHLRALLPSQVTLGVSGDPLAATGLNAGCEARSEEHTSELQSRENLVC